MKALDSTTIRELITAAAASDLYHIVIVGAGFAGLSAALTLKNKKVKLTIIDKNNYHLFQPFLYKVATAELPASDVATPIRTFFTGYNNTKIIMDEVINIEPQHKSLHTKQGLILHYDFLILATGSEINYAKHHKWQQNSFCLKTLPDALAMKNKLIQLLEEAQIKLQKTKLSPRSNIVIVGGGPSGIELSWSIKDFINKFISQDFSELANSTITISVIEQASNILPRFKQSLAEFAKSTLSKKNINIQLNSKVVEINEDSVTLEDGRIMPADMVIWAAGVKAVCINKLLGDGNKEQKITLNDDLSHPLHPAIFVIGDSNPTNDNQGISLPELASIAKQQGIFVAELLMAKINGIEKKFQFRYSNNKGMATTTGRYSAIVQFNNYSSKGFFAWILWNFIHLSFLISSNSKISILCKWLWNHITNNKEEKLVIKK